MITATIGEFDDSVHAQYTRNEEVYFAKECKTKFYFTNTGKLVSKRLINFKYI
jgi:hypothetical protein